jgi:hypothetical protein
MMAPRCRRGTGTPSMTIKSVAHGVCFDHPLRETLMVRYPIRRCQLGEPAWLWRQGRAGWGDPWCCVRLLWWPCR